MNQPAHTFSKLCLLTLAYAASATAHEIEYTVALSGANESPANASPGTGDALISVDLDTVQMDV
ncbi:MAG TPA: hypothetical protein VHS31_17930, partial [Tepidisphaeraceae bacterium]|nr:hypothetical protein [Tepidisphaeraceae bacterium]